MSRVGHHFDYLRISWVVRHCGLRQGFVVSQPWRHYSSSGGQPVKDGSTGESSHDDNAKLSKDAESALSRRLEQMTDESLESGGHAARKAVQDAGFDEELRKRLEEKIASASIRAEHPEAFAQVQLPSSAGRGTRDLAGARPWTGNERVEDTALRMLIDANKPLAPKVTGGAKVAVPRIPTPSQRKGGSAGSRLASARDRSTIYATLKDSGMSQEERDQLSKEMKARFQPTANNLPATLSGLASLANERIENAIASGQFKNLPRGKKMDVDHNAK
jgi:Domain of unknown function (DUF1992)